MKYASVYERAGKVFVRSEDKTVAGFHVAQDQVATLSAEDENGVGSAVKVALDASRAGVPTPSPEAMKSKPPSTIYAAAGVRNWREFVDGAKSITVDSSDGKIKLVPWKNEGARDGFVPIKGHDRTLPDTCSDADLGAAVVTALKDAE